MSALVKRPPQPTIVGPEYVNCIVSQHTGDARITVVSFFNLGNPAVPRKLRHAMIVPYDATLPRESSDYTVYLVPPDSEIAHIEIDVGVVNRIDSPTIGLVVALFTIMPNEDIPRVVHLFANFDYP